MTKIVLIFGLFSTLYLMIMGVYRAGSPEIPWDKKMFEIVWRSIDALSASALSLFCLTIVKLIDFYNKKE